MEPSRVNPLSTVEDMNFTQTISRTINDIQLNLTPLRGLTVDAILGVDTYGQVGRSYIRPYPYQAAAGLPLERYPFGFAASATNTVLQLNTDVNATYQRDLTKDVSLKLIAGFNYQYNQQDFSQANGQNLAPFIETVSGAASTTVRAGYGLTRYNLSGEFAQATVGYRNLAFITGAIRRDRSTIFSASESNQLYPKISGSLVLSDLGFWQRGSFNKAFSAAKLQASFRDAGGLTALDPTDRFYQYLPIAFLGKSTITPSSSLANPAVRPERMRELEFGADLSFVNDRINLGITAYRQRISDLTVNRVVAPSTGGLGLVTNVGTMENKGVEIMLDVVPVRTKDLTWDMTFIFNRNRNRVLSLGSPRIEISNVAGAPVSLLEGPPASVFYGFPYARDANGNLLLTAQGLPQRERGTQDGLVNFTPQRTAEGQPTGAFVRTVIGNPNPNWTGSF